MDNVKNNSQRFRRRSLDTAAVVMIWHKANVMKN